MSTPKNRKARILKNKIDRVRRKLIKGIETAMKNGWEISSGLWADSNGHACAIGAALVQDIKVNNPGLDKHTLTELIRKAVKADETAAAARFLGITETEVRNFTDGFDSSEEPVNYYCDEDKDEGIMTEYGVGSPFYRLGVRLAHKYL